MHDGDDEGGHPEVPDGDPVSRAWIHPSELPNFTGAPTPIPVGTKSTPILRTAAVITVAALLGGTLALTAFSARPTIQMGSSTTLAATPTLVQPVAESMVGLRAASTAGTTTGTGLVLAGGSMVATTVPIAEGASVSLVTNERRLVHATVLRRDLRLGLTLLTPASTLAAPSAAMASASSARASVDVVAEGSTATIRWSDATMRSADAPMMIDSVALGTITASSDLDAVAGSGLVSSDGSLIGLAAPDLGPHTYLPAPLIAALASLMVTNDQLSHGCLKITARTAPKGGVEVLGVDGAGPSSGTLEIGDVVTSLNGTKIQSVSSLVNLLYEMPAASSVDLAVTRGTALKHLAVTLAPSP